MPEVLAFSGVTLFLLGLVVGFVIPAMRSPRIGLSAHLAGTQSGMFLMILALAWSHLAISGWLSPAIAYGISISLYAVFLSLVLAGIFGAGRGLPIAGGGITTTAPRQAIVTLLLAGGSLGTFVAVASIVFTWHWTA